jgi:hypothetical protein
MWTKIYQLVLDQVMWAEGAFKDKTGAEKKTLVIDKLCSIIDVPMVPEFVERPIKVMVFSWVIDLACEKLNWLTDWAFGADTLNAEQLTKTAECLDAPDIMMAKAASVGQTVDERLNSLYEQYKVVPTEVPKEPEEAPVVVEKLAKTDLFDRCLPIILGLEGGYVNNPADPGGETNMGITATTLSAAFAQGIVDHNSVKDLTKKEAGDIYYDLYWYKYGWGELPFEAALCLFDMAVNGGSGMVAKVSQKVLVSWGYDISIDGKYGPKTKAAIWGAAIGNGVEFATDILAQRKAYYEGLSTFPVFGKGWFNRIRKIASACGVVSPV